MIAYLKGKLSHKDPTFLIIECNGVGYQVRVSLNTFDKVRESEEVKIHTYFMVKEDSQTLFGFYEVTEREIFEQLISISGVGGNTAMVILSSLSSEELFNAISKGDVNTLKRVKGIGAKTAGRIILELKDKVHASVDSAQLVSSGPTLSQKREEALAALMRLGFPKSVIDSRIDKIFKSRGEEVSVEEIVKMALRNP